MRTSTSLTTLIACVLLLALPAASAWANAADDKIVTDCQNSPTGSLRGSYPQRQLNHALHHLDGDVREYTGCFDAIKQALLDGAAGGGAGGSGGGGDLGGGGGGTSGGIGSGGGDAGTPTTSGTGASAPVPDAAPPAGAERPVEVAGAAVTPGTLPEIGQDSHRIPTALLLLLVLVGVAALVAAALTIGRRVVGHRGS